MRKKICLLFYILLIFAVAGCKPVEVPNEVTSCGMKKVDCTQLDGWDTGRCEHGVCVPTSCKYSYLLKQDAGGVFSRDVVRCDPVGAIIKFGKYEQDGDDTNGKEDIEWRVLDRDGSKVLLISDKTLDVKRYNETDRSITWEKSTIRSWLNGYDSRFNEDGIDYSGDNFLKTAFSDEEQAKIVNTNVPAHANPEYGTNPGQETIDKIFLLSINEAQKYFSIYKVRRAVATRYVRLKIRSLIPFADFEDSSWLLRSSGSTPGHAAYVDMGGSVNYGDKRVDIDNAVRPAFWMNL